jgi:hypothetical protein
MTKQATSTPRPVTVEIQSAGECEDSLVQQKLDAALAMMEMFLEATKPVYICSEDDPPCQRIEGRVLAPREQAAYYASLNFLERYMDAMNVPGIPEAT